MRVRAIACVLGLLWMAGGCSHVTERLMDHPEGTGTLSTNAPWDGEYQLWQMRSLNNEHQLRSAWVKRGDVIGFDCDKGVVAVAGTNRWELPPGNYSWQRSISEGEVAAWTGLKIVLLPFMVAGAAGGGP
jgi:hypothetical protein